MRHCVAFVLLCAMPGWAGGVGWRGDGTGRHPDAAPPLEWAKTKNVLWRTEVGKSHSSPIVVGERVFLAAEPSLLVCVDWSSGKVIWQKTNSPADLTPEQQAKRDPNRKLTTDWGVATATPVSDGQFVYVSLATGIVACYDLDGNRKWMQSFDLPQVNQYGRSASPVLVGDKLIVTIHHLFALDAKTGQPVWHAEESKPTYSTPLLTKIGEVDVVVTPGGDVVCVSDGRILASGLGKTWFTSPIVQDGVAYFVDPEVKAVKLPEKADEPFQPQKLWEQELDGELYSSPVCHDGLIYVVNNRGVLFVLDAKTGKMVLEKELDIPSASGKPGLPAANIYPSIELAGKHLFVSNDIGDTIILAPGREYREVRRNRLPEGAAGTAAFAGKRILVRGGKSLYCIGERE